MHNLEKLIAEWRKTMMAAPKVSHETLDELENHLRENVDHLVRSGMTGPEAFQCAHRFACSTARGVLIMSLLGNIVVSLAWFGANLLAGLHSYGTRNYSLLLLAAVVFNFVFFVIGLAPAGWLRPRKVL